jgi:BirA family transcriptional regulator, biotin operon repressor / biotin---[acetyl-CoA-carboxylase] ligase
MSNPDTVILKALLQADGEFVSGSDLATQLGMSRVGVWSRLEKLREEGFHFEGVRHKGYRLMAEPQALHAQLLEVYLEHIDQQVAIHFHDSIDSTNSEAERLLAAGTPTPFVVVAGEQTHGRGRLGRVWHSPRIGNLYASFVFRPGLPYPRMQNITLWLGAQVCDYINRTTGLPVGLKWPNDLILDNRKVAGMLTEARIDADHTRDLVYGLGLNICGRIETWPEEVAKMATCLSAHTSEPLKPNLFAAGLITAVLQAYDSFINTDVTPLLLKLWQRYDVLTGKQISTSRNGKPINGTAEGIDASGALLLRTESGEIQRLHSGEVSIGSANLSSETSSG